MGGGVRVQVSNVMPKVLPGWENSLFYSMGLWEEHSGKEGEYYEKIHLLNSIRQPVETEPVSGLIGGNTDNKAEADAFLGNSASVWLKVWAAWGTSYVEAACRRKVKVQ